MPVVREKLREVADRLRREALDVEVAVRFQRRIYAGRARHDVQALRVVGIRDDAAGCHHFYVTNVPVEKLAAEDIRATYALRWQVELPFKELKRHYRIDQIPELKTGRRLGERCERMIGFLAGTGTIVLASARDLG